MKILVTGATGFVGSHLTKKLLSDGHRVFGTTRNGTTDEKFTLLKLDLSDKYEMMKLPKNIDIVYHVAAQIEDVSFHDYLMNNVLATKNLLNYYQDKKLKLFVYSSTISTLSPHTDIINENSEILHPISDYALTKLWCENLAEEYSSNVNFKCVVLRYPSVYGTGQIGGIIHYYYDAAINNRNINVFCMGETYRNVVHVSDVVKANISVINNDKVKKSDLFLIGSKDSMQMIRIAEDMKKLLNSKSELIITPKKTFSDHDVVLDLSKARKILDYDPLTVEEGMKLYVEEMTCL